MDKRRKSRQASTRGERRKQLEAELWKAEQPKSYAEVLAIRRKAAEI